MTICSSLFADSDELLEVCVPLWDFNGPNGENQQNCGLIRFQVGQLNAMEKLYC